MRNIIAVLLAAFGLLGGIFAWIFTDNPRYVIAALVFWVGVGAVNRAIEQHRKRQEVAELKAAIKRGMRRAAQRPRTFTVIDETQVWHRDKPSPFTKPGSGDTD